MKEVIEKILKINL